MSEHFSDIWNMSELSPITLSLQMAEQDSKELCQI